MTPAIHVSGASRLTSTLAVLQELAGDAWPLSHERHYVQRSAETGEPAAVLAGRQEDYWYDALVIMTFADGAAFRAFMARMSEPAAAVARREADEERFLDRSSLSAAVLGDVCKTGRGEVA